MLKRMNKINRLLVLTEETIEFKNKVTKDKAKVDKWSDNKKLDQFDDEKSGNTFYLDKDGNVVAAYNNKDKQLHTNIDKDEIDKEII